LLSCAQLGYAQSLQLRYALDDKYADVESDSLDRWILTSLQTPGDEIFNLLQAHGGGPQGAEWNPSTDLIYFVYGIDDHTLPNCLLNGTPVQLSILKTADACAMVLPFEVWIDALQPLNESNAESVIGGEFDFEIHFANAQFKSSFHAAFGE
jgi:hypothetical protein